MHQKTGSADAENPSVESPIVLDQKAWIMDADDTVHIREPVTQNVMVLSDWLSAARDSFQKLSVSISKELGIQLQ